MWGMSACIMFRQNAHVPVGLTQEQPAGGYFRLYYQFIKHAFGLSHRPPTGATCGVKNLFRRTSLKPKRPSRSSRDISWA